MSDQFQCTNCGGYKVELLKKVDKKGVRPRTMSERIKFSILIAVVGVAIGLLGAVIGAITKTTDSDFLGMIITLGICGFPLLALVLFMGKTMSVLLGTTYHLRCTICGYEWTWETGTPIPHRKVKPDLIAKGAQDLEKKRKRSDEAASHNLSKRKK